MPAWKQQPRTRLSLGSLSLGDEVWLTATRGLLGIPSQNTL